MIALWLSLALFQFGAAERIQTAPVEGPEHLSRFFAALSARAGSPPRGRVRVTQIGDSHIAADMWSGRMRTLFQARFGDGGRGFVLPGKPWRSYWQNHVRGEMEGDWRVDLKAEGLDDGRVGPGTCAVASGEPASHLRIGSATKGEGGRTFAALDVFYLRQAGGGCFELRVRDPADAESPDEAGGDRLLGRVSTAGPWAEPDFRRFDLTAGPHLVTLRPLDSGGTREVRLLGFSLENPEGAIWEALGVNGAQARALLKQDPVGMARVLRRLGSDLIVLSFGTNELYDGKLSMDAYAAQLAAVLRLLREAAPQADCLVTGPFDLLKGRRPPANFEPLLAIQRTRSAAAGCAFWDARAAMGGPGSIRAWRRQGLAQADFVHLTRPGYERIADLLETALLASWQAAQVPVAPVPPPP